MSSKCLDERSDIFDIFRSTQNESEYDVSNNDNPEFVARCCDSSSSDDESGPSGRKGARSRSSMSASSVKGRGGKQTSSSIHCVASTSNSSIIHTAGSDIDFSDDDDDSELSESETPEVAVHAVDLEVAVQAVDLAEDWSRDLTDFPSIPPFTGPSGLNTNLIDIETASPFSVFRIFIDDFIIKHFKEETNKYACELSHTPPFSEQTNVKSWKPVTLCEIKGFLLLLLHMGTVKKPCLSDYWTLAEFIATKFAARILSRDRFRAILSMLHFSDNSSYIPVDAPGHDPLHKIRTFYEHLQRLFQEVYVPEKHVAVDEAMCAWRGKLRFKVYLKDKPTPWGIKFYELCESGSGYVYRFEIYAREPGLSNKPTDVVLRLVDPILDSGYHLFTDNFYTCPELFNALVSRQTMCTGTVRSNKIGMPKDLSKQALRVGEYDFRRKGDLVALKCHEKREVNMLTSAYDPTENVTVSTRNVQNKVKPKTVVEYSKYMSAVDHNDQLMSYLPLARRTSKWTNKIFMHLLILTAIQSWVLMNKIRAKRNQPALKLKDFILQLGESLTEEFLRERAITPYRPEPKVTIKPEMAVRLDRSKFHSLASLPATATKKKPKRDCKVCYDKTEKVPGKRKRVKETRYWCKVCLIPLCLEPCFELFHTCVNYKDSAWTFYH